MSLKIIVLGLSILLFSASFADEWGSWDDLPDNILSSEIPGKDPVNELYQLLKSDPSLASDKVHSVEQWIQTLNLEFEDNEALDAFVQSLDIDSDEDINEALENWLDEQIEDSENEFEDINNGFDDSDEDHDDSSDDNSGDEDDKDEDEIELEDEHDDSSDDPDEEDGP